MLVHKRLNIIENYFILLVGQDVCLWWLMSTILIQTNLFNFVFSGSVAQRGLWPPRSWGFVITHNDAPRLVGILWTSDQLVAETSPWHHTTNTTEKHPCPGGIRTHNRSRRAAVDLCLRLRGHWDRPNTNKCTIISRCSLITTHPPTCFGHLRGHIQGGINKNTITFTKEPEQFHNWR
jgi:hypothetical protein